MSAELALISLLNGVSHGLLLFMLAAGLTLIFSMLGVLNFAHASFYMLGAYVGYQVSLWAGFWAALVVAPLFVAALGAAVEHYGLRRVHRAGHIPELLFTFGLALIIAELVQVVWGRPPVPNPLPEALQGALFTVYGIDFPRGRTFIMLLAVLVMAALWVVLKRTRIGLIIQAALTHPQQVEALGHDVQRLFRWVFSGGCALAALAGVIGGAVFVTEPGMAAAAGAILFVVIVVGGLGSLAGTFIAALLIGLLQAFAVTIDVPLAALLQSLGFSVTAATPGYSVWRLTLAQVAPVLPFVLLVLVLVVRPKGLMGTREG